MIFDRVQLDVIEDLVRFRIVDLQVTLNDLHDLSKFNATLEEQVQTIQDELKILSNIDSKIKTLLCRP